MDKLRADLEILFTCDVVCLQECSPAWQEIVRSLAPSSWMSADDEGATLLTMWNTNYLTVARKPKVMLVFPDFTSKFKVWRTCLAVALRVPGGGPAGAH